MDLHLHMSGEGRPGPLGLGFGVLDRAPRRPASSPRRRMGSGAFGVSEFGLRVGVLGPRSPQDGPRPPPRPQDPFKTVTKDPKIANIDPKSGPRSTT